MFASLTTPSRAFRDLDRSLARRRWLQLDPRMRVELGLLAVLIGGFLFWQTRVPLDGMVRAHGPMAGVTTLASALGVLLILALPLAALRHARRLHVGPPGPEWLALPVEPGALASHLAAESSGLALWLTVPALGFLLAAVGLVPILWTIAFAAAFVPALSVTCRLGGTLGLALAARSVDAGSGTAIERVLAAAAPRRRRRHRAAPRWRRRPAWLAIVEKDLQMTRYRGPLRRGAWVALILWALSLAAWSLRTELALRHFVAFGLALLAAAALAQWLVGLSGSDPFAGLRALPVGLAGVWGARFAWALLGTALIVAGHAIAARELAPHAMRVFLTWIGLATLGVAVLGINYGVTLFPRADVAERMLGLSLGLATAASIMIPLSGWIVLLTAILHSARRLPRWSRLEEI